MAVKPKSNDDGDFSTGVMEAPVVQVKNEDINFFSAIDRNHKGEINSEEPAWCNPLATEKLRDEVAQIDAGLKRGEITGAREPVMRAELEKLAKRLDMIESSVLKLTSAQKDRIYREMKDLGEKVADLMFTRSEMKLGVADAHMEASRMVDPCVSLTPWQAEQMNRAGMRLWGSENPRTNRTCAERLWKICRKALGELANTEILRKP